jgi:hypothetical protein
MTKNKNWKKRILNYLRKVCMATITASLMSFPELAFDSAG